MAKVIFEFDDEKDSREIKNIINRDEFIFALDELINYRRTLYKGFQENRIVVKDGKIVNPKEFKNAEDIKGTIGYIPVDDVIEELDRCLRDVVNILDY